MRHDHGPRCDDLGLAESAVAVVVHRLEYPLARAQQSHMLGHDVEVIAGRVQRGDVLLCAFYTVVRVIVVLADVGDAIGTQDRHDPIGES